MALKYNSENSATVLWPYAFAPNGKLPIDNRSVVDSVDDLNISTTFSKKSYVGMLVYVIQANSYYVLTSENTETGTWTQLPTLDNLDSLSKAFTFQGVAQAIDPDNCTLTLTGAKSASGEFYKVIKSLTDIEGDLYYGWGTSTEIEFWTRGQLENGVMSYTKTDYNVEYFQFDGEVYYDGEEGSPDGTKLKCMSVSGDVLWVDSDKNIYVLSTDTTSIASAEWKQGDAYTFKENARVTGVTGTATLEQAADHNKGHVYQLGEEEYASNGTIWVKLGSPKEDWIVIK